MNLYDNISPQYPAPLDKRTAVSDKTGLSTFFEGHAYDGMLVYCKADDTYYEYLSTNPVDPDTGKFKVFSTAGNVEALTEEQIKQSITDNFKEQTV